MSEFPERIWAYEFENGDTVWHYNEIHGGGNVKYLRADLPPTLSAAMELPEIKALVEALELAANRLHRCAVDYDTGTLRFYETCEWTDEACAALAAIKEPKT